MENNPSPRKPTRTGCAVAIGASLALVVIIFLCLEDSGKIKGRRIITFREKPFRVEVEKRFLVFPLSHEQCYFPLIEQAYPDHSWKVAGRTYEDAFRLISFGGGHSEFHYLYVDLSMFEARLSSSKSIPSANRVDEILLGFVEHNYWDSPAGRLEDLWVTPSSRVAP